MMPRGFLGAGNSPVPPQTHDSTRILVQTDFFQVLKIFGPHMLEIDLVGAPHGTQLLFFYRESIAFTSLELMWKSYTKILKNKKVRAENILGGKVPFPPHPRRSAYWSFKKIDFSVRIFWSNFPGFFFVEKFSDFFSDRKISPFFSELRFFVSTISM